MNEHDDLERTLEHSLRHRTGRLDAPPPPGLDVVWDRVDRRRQRRRHLAVVGSVAAVAVGAFGFAAVAGTGPNQAAAPGDAAGVPDQQAAWRCTDQLDHFEEGSPAVFFVTCEQVAVDGSASVFDLPTPTTPSASTFDPSGTAVATTVPGRLITHVVQAGETLSSISESFGVPIDEIVMLNAWDGDADVELREGEVIVIALTQADPMPTVPVTTLSEAVATTTTSIVTLSPSEQVYEVERGDSLGSIAASYAITLDQLVNYNEFENGLSHVLIAGDQIRIPPGAYLAPDPLSPTSTTTSTP